MDWLQTLGTMSVDWKMKWMSFSLAGEHVYLQGNLPAGVPYQLVELYLLQQPAVDNSNQVLPYVIQDLLDKFSILFEEPKGLPPHRGSDHHIPLVAGATPIRSRPYHHSPEVKTEIERKVAKMLATGVIHASDSAFSSPIICVRKSDFTWRICVNFCGLNALTTKTKYPLPVIDKLLDELTGSCRFSKFDMRVGYHHILLAPSEEHKTAFTTHQGQYEFLVMTFGLTGAPATFQRVMNKSLAPVLRKCAIVFFDDILVYSDMFSDHVQHLEQVLTVLVDQQWCLKPSK
jgi:hypothetical protein